MTPQQSKTLKICIGLVVAWYLMRYVTGCVEMAQYRAQAAEQQKFATPGLPGIPPGRLIGIWEGTPSPDGRGACNFKVEIRGAQGPQGPRGSLAGFTTLTCHGIAQASNPAPQTSILAGGQENGSIQFHVVKVVDAGAGCPPTSLTLTAFGSNQIAAEWQEQGCAGGHALLRRTHS